MARIWGERHSIEVGWAGIEIFYNNGGKNGGKVFGGHGIRFYSTSKSSLASGPLQPAIKFSCTCILFVLCFLVLLTTHSTGTTNPSKRKIFPLQSSATRNVRHV